MVTWWHDDMMTGSFADDWLYGIFYLIYLPELPDHDHESHGDVHQDQTLQHQSWAELHRERHNSRGWRPAQCLRCSPEHGALSVQWFCKAVISKVQSLIERVERLGLDTIILTFVNSVDAIIHFCQHEMG